MSGGEPGGVEYLDISMIKLPHVFPAARVRMEFNGSHSFRNGSQVAGPHHSKSILRNEDLREEFNRDNVTC
jgi:hypothetical protein